MTREPLLKELLKYVITDEARHVHYGVLAMREFVARVSESERREREDWAFEVALLLRNRFLAHEFYDEYYAHAMSASGVGRARAQLEDDVAVPQDDVQAHHPQPQADRPDSERIASGRTTREAGCSTASTARPRRS